MHAAKHNEKYRIPVILSCLTSEIDCAASSSTNTKRRERKVCECVCVRGRRCRSIEESSDHNVVSKPSSSSSSSIFMVD